MDRYYTVATAPFEAARQVTILPPGHRATHLHGHSFVARVRVAFPNDDAFLDAETDPLRERLADCLRPLDYALLNDRLPVPTDENLARWIRQQLNIPGIEQVGVQSTHNQGVDLDAQDHAHVWRRFRFEAAHQLPHVPSGHPCGRMHGHGFEVILHADQNVAEQDMGIDFDVLGEFWRPLQAELDYGCLNDLPGLENPTSERLAAWIWDRLKPTLPVLSWVTVYETVTAGCHFDGVNYRIWKEQRFESALQLKRAPEGDRRRRLHGHSYLIRMHLTAPLDEVMGWTVDYGDVKALFKPVYDQLDHRRLDELPNLPEPTLPALLHWIQMAMIERLPSLDRIDLYQSPGCGALLCWGSEGPALPV